MNWDPRELTQVVEKLVMATTQKVEGEGGKEFLRRFRRTLNGYVYMNTARNGARPRRGRARNV
jgi:hypothetical protein